MLKIQRASAGSGKTYALAKKYILEIIAYKTEKGDWYIRNERQIEDALTHILAITFTNKATNEMKTRIIDNLSLLSLAADLKPSQNPPANIPYIKEYHKETGLDYKSIGVASKIALRTILNNFSTFKISTIDSFFQEILRTFTYEANLNESYQLEIDSSYVADAALDSAFSELDSNPRSMGNAAFWLTILMKQEAKKSQKWNLFNKKATSRSIYANIRKALAQLESEDFKEIKDELDSYFEKNNRIKDLPSVFLKLQKLGTEERRDLLDQIRLKRLKIEEILNTDSFPEGSINKNFFSQIKKIAQLKEEDKLSFKFTQFLNSRSIFNSDFRDKDYSIPLDTVAIEMYELLKEWDEPSYDSFYKNWKIYGGLLPYLGLILEVRKFLADILKSSNIIQLSDTSFILKKIIGENDAPFVYERLGNRLDNYLIDEFQDTSRMQWDVIYPLLLEGIAKDKESLIIGDPKQSIYRFRNADHTLITHVVPNIFQNHTLAGFSIEDNTNWRSHTRIVKFNNYFFKSLASGATELSEDSHGRSYNFNDLYSNVVQYPNNQEGKGYLEIRILNKSSKENEDYSDMEDEDIAELNKDWFERKALGQLGPLLTSLIEKGYRQKDIAILVNTNEKGKKVVNQIIDYNSALKIEDTKIDFISEDSLLIASSPAVEMLIGVLEKMIKSESINSLTEENTEKKKPVYRNWKDVKLEFILFSKDKGDLNPIERLLAFLKASEFENSLPDLLKELPTPSLSSIIEMAAVTFIDSELRNSDAVYISAFQDLITEYSATHHSDPASFLDWWAAKGKNVSLTSPDDIDAVNIMTIHKSKGLEFKCVILPFANDSFKPNSFREEWRWVAPLKIADLELPPVLPVKTSTELKGSIHEKIYYDYFNQVVTDKLNMYYVAFTRAKNELYIFTQESKAKTPAAINDFISHICEGKVLPEFIRPDEKNLSLKLEDLIFNEKNDEYVQTVITYGNPFTPQEIKEELLKEGKKESKDSNKSTEYIEDYFINKKRPSIRSVASKIHSSDEL